MSTHFEVITQMIKSKGIALFLYVLIAPKIEHLLRTQRIVFSHGEIGLKNQRAAKRSKEHLLSPKMMKRSAILCDTTTISFGNEFFVLFAKKGREK